MLLCCDSYRNRIVSSCTRDEQKHAIQEPTLPPNIRALKNTLERAHTRTLCTLYESLPQTTVMSVRSPLDRKLSVYFSMVTSSMRPVYTF